MIRLSTFMFLLYCTNSIIVFFFPLYLQDTGMNPEQIGIVVAVGALISIFARPFWGYMCDRKKTVKRVLFLTMVGALLMSLGLFSLHTFALLVLFSFLFFLFNSAWIPLTDTLTLSFAHRHGYHYGMFRMWGAIGGGLSALMLGYFTDRLGMSALFWAHTGVLLVAMFVCAGLEDADKAKKPVTLRSLKQLFANRTVLFFLLAALAIGVPHRMNDSMLSLFLSELGATETMLGLAWMIATFSSAPVLLLSGRILNKYGELKVFVCAALLYAIRWALYGQAHDPSMLVFAQLLHSVTFPLFFVSSIQFIAKISPEELRSTGQTAFAAVFGGLGGVIGSALGGWIIHAWGVHYAYTYSAALVLLGMVLLIPVRRDARRISIKRSL